MTRCHAREMIDEPAHALPPAVRGALMLELALFHGGRATAEIRYEVTGPDAAPVVVVAGGISATRHTLANKLDPAPGWWQDQATTFAPYRILAIDWVGVDGLLDQPIDAADQAVAVLAVMDRIGVARALAFVGGSYGAMVGMQAVRIAPDRFGGLFAMSAAHRSHPFASALRALQRQAVELGERLGDWAGGVELARKLAILTYRTPEEFGERFSDRLTIEHGRASVGAESYLDHHGAKYPKKMSAAAYRRLSESIDLHRIDPAAIGVPALFLAASDDRLVPVEDTRTLAEAVEGARFAIFQSPFGHDSFLKEHDAIGAHLTAFLTSPELGP